MTKDPTVDELCRWLRVDARLPQRERAFNCEEKDIRRLIEAVKALDALDALDISTAGIYPGIHLDHRSDTWIVRLLPIHDAKLSHGVTLAQDQGLAAAIVAAARFVDAEGAANEWRRSAIVAAAEKVKKL